MKDVKSGVNVALDKALHGGKKGKGGKGKEEEKKVIEHCAIFMAVDYAEWKKQVIEILSQFQFENNKIVGNHIPVIQEKLKGPNAGNAMKFAAFLLEEVAQQGKEKALEVKTPFDELPLLEENKDFIFENMNSIKEVVIARNSDEAVHIEGDKNARDNSQPGKPSVYFY